VIPTHRLSIAAAAVVLAVPALSSCGTNFNAPTGEVYTPGVGVNERSGSVDVLNAVIVSGAEGSGTLVASLVNNDQTQDDALIQVAGAGEDATITVTGGTAEVPADELVRLAEDGQTRLQGDQVKPGYFVELSFTFERGETVTLNAPVVENTDEYADIPVS